MTFVDVDALFLDNFEAFFDRSCFLSEKIIFK